MRLGRGNVPGPRQNAVVGGVRVGRSSLRSQALLLPLGVPPVPAPAMLHNSVIPMAVGGGGGRDVVEGGEGGV